MATALASGKIGAGAALAAVAFFEGAASIVSMSGNCHAFVRQQPALDAHMEALQIAVVGETAEATGRRDPMAGNDQRKPVGAASLADRARRRLHQPRHRAVSRHGSLWNSADGLPDAALKC